MFQDGRFHIVPSVRNLKNLDRALRAEEEWILLSAVHIGNLKECVARCHLAGKRVIVNHEIVGGLGADRMSFQMLRQMFQVDAVMGASGAKIGLINREEMRSIRRIVLSDSLSVEQSLRSLREIRCDAIELRPAYYAARYLEQFREAFPCEYVAGGFVDTQEMLEEIREAGFSGAMTSCVELW